MIDASLLPGDNIVGEVEVGISNLLAMNELLTEVVSRTMENKHKRAWFIQTDTNDRYSEKNIPYLFFSFH